MKGPVFKRLCLAFAAWAILLSPSAQAFSLLGPFAPWMSPNLGYHKPGDIGGPMNLGEEYRWAVPVVTYGFDQSFLDYFGQPGVDAVEEAIQILNDLPPASEMDLANFPFISKGANYYAWHQGLCDLKSRTLCLLLEQMGLAESTRYVWTVRQWNPVAFCQEPFLSYESGISAFFGPAFTNYINRRGYDPTTQQPTSWVNARYYTFYMFTTDVNCEHTEAVELPVDGFFETTTVTDGDLDFGYYFTGLSYDDTGGLLYLLNRTNVNVERLDDSILTPGGNTNELIRTVPRPGVEKITFVRHPSTAAGGFSVMTNRFDDRYFTNGLLATQQVCRITSQPDILFRAKDLGCVVATNDLGQRLDYLVFPFFAARTDTSHWLNHAALNSNPDGDGPGVIRPPIEISFHTPGRYLAATGGSVGNTNYSFWNWASFSEPPYTNIIAFPGNQTNLTSLTLATRTFVTNASPTFEWTLLGRPGKRYRIEAATNLADWSALATVTNLGGVFQFTHPLAQPRQFFRAVLEE